MAIETVNPATGKLIHSYPEMSDQTIHEIIESTHDDFLHWSNTPIKARSEYLFAVATLLRKDKTQLAELMANEMGKPITLGSSEVEKCASLCEYYAEQAEVMLKPELVNTDLKKSLVCYKPSGCIFAIMPWNFPFWQVFRFAVPNLMAGNGCLLKHAPISTGSSLAIEKIFQLAGLPENIFRSLIISTDQAANVIANEKVTGVTLTGSGRAGQAVATHAGKHLKKVVLELGGSDPYLILSDADLELATNICVNSRLVNSGQVCIAAKRIIIEDAIFDEVTTQIQEKMQDYPLGDPLLDTTKMGPMAREDLRAQVQLQVQKTLDQGAHLISGGKIPSGAGFYYPATLITDVVPGMVAFDEEVFGPVITLIRANNLDHGIQLANQTQYGLGAAIFTSDVSKGESIAINHLHSGTCAVNTFVRSDPHLPFGGIKASGYGRELAKQGLVSFMNTKTIQIN